MRVEETMEWLRQLETLAHQRMDAVLVLAVERKGSTPGAFGAKMLVTAEGRVYGTIGGGQMEYHCEQLARELISQKRSSLERLALNPEGPGELGMICGGDVTVWFQYLPGARLPVEEGTGASYLVLEQDANGQGRARVCGASAVPDKKASGRLTDLPQGGFRYVERLESPREVYIFGGGHIAQALVPGLVKTGFRCHVFDDREEYASAQVFPQAVEVAKVEMEHLEEISGRITAEDFVCVMTHGHRHDHAVVSQVLRTPAAYIGVIGSAKKAAASREKLQQEGFGPGDLARIVTPIGLAIGAETPEEIAVSILAQLIEKRAQLRTGEVR